MSTCLGVEAEVVDHAWFVKCEECYPLAKPNPFDYTVRRNQGLPQFCKETKKAWKREGDQQDFRVQPCIM